MSKPWLEVVLDKQQEKLEAYCAKHGITVKHVIREIAGGCSNNLEMVLTTLNDTDGVIALSPDRISRDWDTFNAFTERVEAAGKQIVYTI